MSSYPKSSRNYSSSANNFVKDFVLSHQLSFNAISDKWNNIQPFHKEFRAIKKTGPVYAMHRYWTKQPIAVITEYIQHFCPPGGLVLDPFCGTGTTGTAALYCGRSAVLTDLSPIATFIAKNYTEKVDLSKVEKSFQVISEIMLPIVKNKYTTNCFQCFNPADIKDWLYSEVYACPSCKKPVPFISPNTSWTDIESRKHNKLVTCNICDEMFSRDFARFLNYIPIGIRFACKTCKFRKKLKDISKLDREKYIQTEQQDWHKSIPKTPLPIGVNTSQPFSRNIKATHQFFTKNTANVLGSLWEIIAEIKDPITRSKFQFIFSSIIYRVSRLYRLRVKGQGGILSGTLYLPPIFQDINVWDVFKERYRKILKGWHEINSKLTYKNNDRIISTQSATSLFNIPNNTIDYVYTDPPYGGNINYSELNLLWEVWFGLITDPTEEVIINEIGQSKSLKEYKELFQKAIQEIFRVLKPGRWLTLVFNSSSTKIWGMIQEIILDTGFLMAKNISKIESNMTTAKQTESKKTARRFILLNIQKPTELNNKLNQRTLNTLKLISYSIEKYESVIINYVSSFLQKKNPPQAGYDEIYDEIITNLLPNINIMEFNLEKILNKHFNSISNDIWRLGN